jgi:hypothetical protein
VIRPGRRTLLFLLGAWLLFAIPFVAVGANDVEDFYTAVTTTKIVIDSMFGGASPFWSMDSALGVPQPFRFHFITDPLSPLCHVWDCAQVLRLSAALHVLLGVVFMALLVRRITSDESVACLAGLTFLFSSSIVQPTYVDDWSTTVIAVASLPVLIYAAYALLAADRPRDALRWSLVLGGVSGFTLSMVFPYAVLLPVALFLLTQPRATLGRWRWLLLAAGVAVLIGGGHLYHLWEQYQLTPPSVHRDDHEEPALLTHLWSAFVRPVAMPWVMTSWRTVFIGAPLAIAAAVSFVSKKDAALRPFKLAILIAVALWFIPESWLFNLMTNRWGYRQGINVFGIVLGACAIAQLHRTPGRAPIARVVMALQIVAIGVAFWPEWAAVAQAATDPRVLERSQRVNQKSGVTPAVAALEKTTYGRVAVTPHVSDLMRRFMLTRDGLAPNQLQIAGVPSLYAEAHGITLDPIAPMRYAFIGISPPTAAMVTTAATLNVLGVRYVIAMPEDAVSDRLHLVQTVGGMRIFENADAWPEAFFVPRFPSTPLPRLPDCGHDRFFCVDFARADIERDPTPIMIDRHRDGMTLRFAPSNEPRRILVTQWYQPHWRVTAGSAHLVRAAEQVLGLEVAPGEQRVTIEFLPVFRAVLFFGGIVTEAAVLLLIVWLSLV